MHGFEEVSNVLMIEMKKFQMIERLEVFLNVFTGFVNFGKSEKTEETLANFYEKSKRLKKKRKEI